MDGQLACGDSYTVDNFTQYRINNGQFRMLTIAQWRAIAGRFNRSPLMYLPAGSGAAQVAGNVIEIEYQSFQTGVVFLNLFRISDGSDMQVLIKNGTPASEISSVFPVWVAPIGSKGTGRPKQTVTSKDSPTKTVMNEMQNCITLLS